MNLPLVFIYKCVSERNLNPTPGEPREQHLDEVRQGTIKLKFNTSNPS